MIALPIDSGSGKPPRRLPRPRLALSGALAAAAVVVVLVGVFLHGSTPSVDPSPPRGYGTGVDPASDPSPSSPPGALPAGGPDGGLLPDPSDPAPGPEASPRPVPAVPVSSGRLEDLLSGPVVEPVRLVIGSLGVDAPIRAVGVNGAEMEVPPTADLVGWYRFGPAPGEAGSAVLAAHVSWGGERGAFYRLRDLPPAAEIEVWFADGSVRRFRSAALTSYDKGSLPVEQIFSRDGAPVLTLITCGGAFNQSLRRFDQNVVAYAVPVGLPGSPGQSRPGLDPS